MICSPFGRADFTASAVLQDIRSEAPRLHGLRLAHAANSAREKYGLSVLEIEDKPPSLRDYAYFAAEVAPIMRQGYVVNAVDKIQL